ncbi:MAG: DUF1801 domain-containing protein [Acidobacteria bacterium]|nr:DUF1801 domain-containing protein [Acidobacteriota bacterium]
MDPIPLFRFSQTYTRDPAIEAWFAAHADALGQLARKWFEVMLACGDDVREILHDGQPTACIGDVAFAYVNAFQNHVNVGFFHGSDLADPAALLQGSGKRMRHVKLWPNQPTDPALPALVAAAYQHLKSHL